VRRAVSRDLGSGIVVLGGDPFGEVNRAREALLTGLEPVLGDPCHRHAVDDGAPVEFGEADGCQLGADRVEDAGEGRTVGVD
jgi:hypothetical protein